MSQPFGSLTLPLSLLFGLTVFGGTAVVLVQFISGAQPPWPVVVFSLAVWGMPVSMVVFLCWTWWRGAATARRLARLALANRTGSVEPAAWDEARTLVALISDRLSGPNRARVCRELLPALTTPNLLRGPCAHAAALAMEPSSALDEALKDMSGIYVREDVVAVATWLRRYGTDKLARLLALREAAPPEARPDVLICVLSVLGTPDEERARLIDAYADEVSGIRGPAGGPHCFICVREWQEFFARRRRPT